MKIKLCCICKKELPLTEFHKCKNNKDGLKYQCKSCRKQYANKNKKYISKYKKEYYQKNKNKIIEQINQYKQSHKEWYENYKKQWYKENKNKRLKQIKQWNISSALYNTYNKQINWCEQTRNNNGYLEVKCINCNKWFKPTNKQVQHRVSALNNVNIGENRFYCSNKCKQSCSIFYQQSYPKNYKPYLDREVQPELRQLVFERDNYTCIKCGSTKSLHCHHIKGIHWEPIESADIDSCITVCKSCHMKIHKQVGCTYQEFQCKD